MSPPNKRGFAAMDPEEHRAIARMGGKAANEKGTRHRFTRKEARKAGRKGGLMISQDRQHMSEIGKLGGMANRTRREAEDLTHDRPTTQELGNPITGANET